MSLYKAIIGTTLGALSFALISGGSAHAQATISTLFNTGVNASNAVLASGTVDPHYNFSAASPNTYAISPDPAWATNSSASPSAYIAPDTVDGGQENGGTYTTTFTLPANANLSSVNIVGNWCTDNSGTDIVINGHSTGFTSPSFTSFTSFTVPTGFYTTGTNTLDFKWANAGGPGGLNVYFTTKTFNSAAAPEPGALGLLALAGAPLLGTVIRRRARR